MKLGELNMRCGGCSLLDESLCGEPFSDVCPCCRQELADMSEDDYINAVREIRSKSRRHWSNATLENKICRMMKEKNNERK